MLLIYLAVVGVALPGHGANYEKFYFMSTGLKFQSQKIDDRIQELLFGMQSKYCFTNFMHNALV